MGALRGAGVGRGDLVAVALAPGVGLGVAALDAGVPGLLGASWAVAVPAGGAAGTEALAAVVGAIDRAVRPRWVLWSNQTAVTLAGAGTRISTSWDIAAVHRLRFGGWRADAGRCWAGAYDLDVAGSPTMAPVDLFDQSGHDGDLEDPRRPDGYLRPEWVDGAWAASIERVQRWAETALAVALRQRAQLQAGCAGPTALATARSESAAELLCAELSVDGLPMDRRAAEALVASIVGPRPSSDADRLAQRAARDAEVLRHVGGTAGVDLRSPGQVKALLRRVGIEVPDTRAARLTPFRDTHPFVPALLAWRKAERVATTYGYGWLDEHLGADGRLRGVWSGSDGAAGRMTASAGLHNMPAELRPAVMAEPGHLFVRADLGQIEPRVLASVSGDAALARASQEPDMYAPVAAQLGVDRPTAKVAVLGAMYGQTTGHGAQALRGLRAAYPVAMAYLDDADRAAQAGRDLRTYGGRRIPLGGGVAGLAAGGVAGGGSAGGSVAGGSVGGGSVAGDAEGGGGGYDSGARAAARGRYGRNAMVQGAAAELFKVWAATVRARGQAAGARIVLCLHDELLVQVPARAADEAALLVERALSEAVGRWAPDSAVRFVADISVIERWSDAKG